MPGQLVYKNGDIFTSTANVVAHGCNCRGGFGSGVAGQIARLYPKVRRAYLDKFWKDGWELGQVQFVSLDPHQWYWIANMATQDMFGGPGVLVSYDAVRQCFETVLKFCEDSEYTLAIPKVGAGLAGGDWTRIESIIIDLLKRYNVQVTCYVYET